MRLVRIFIKIEICRISIRHKLTNILQVYLPRIGVQDDMFEKLFGIYETRNEPLRLTEGYMN